MRIFAMQLERLSAVLVAGALTYAAACVMPSVPWVSAAFAHEECDAAPDCDDRDPCNGFESCVGGHCVTGTPLDCDDHNVCTTDYCQPRQGCRHDPNAAPCSDGNVCNGMEFCKGRTCRAGHPLRCLDDGNECTADVCDPALGCVHEPRDGGPCGRGACIADGECVFGECVGEFLCDPECQRCEEGECVRRCDLGGETPTASLALSILRAAVELEECAACVCDLDADGEVTSIDALLALRAAVGVEPICPVSTTTSTTIGAPTTLPTTSTTATSTTTTTSTTSTVRSPTTTTILQAQ